MSQISWGKPTVEAGLSVAGAAATSFSVEFNNIKEDTAKLTPTKGTKKEAKEEGGGIVDVRYDKNSFTFELQIFVKKGETRPIQDNDGLITDEYSVRLTPEDSSNEGFIMDRCNVSVEESWTSADGKLLKYVFEGLKPATGNILKPYTSNS